MTHFKLTYHHFSERSILVLWPAKIDDIILKDVLIFKNSLQKLNIELIVDINHAYNSFLITYHSTIDNFNSTVSALKACYLNRNSSSENESVLWKIPVCYDTEFALDLKEISEVNQLSKSEIIEHHTRPIYTVYFIGFLPGFLYLGGLDKLLHFPRKKNPRLMIEKGAVAIGGNQTGIYPNASPAGWNVIGNCPLELFDVKKNPPCFAKAGDQVQFYEIDKKEHAIISEETKNKTFRIMSFQ